MPEWPPRCDTGPSISLSGAFSPESQVITNCPSGIFMSGAHLDSMDWAKAIASLRSFMHAINIGGRTGASVETPYGPPLTQQPTTLSIRRPDDWHVHLRDGPMLAACAVTRPAVRPRHHHAQPGAAGDRVAEAAAYRDRIRRAVPADLGFEPLMTCYLTDGADPAELKRGKEEGVWVAAKLYPAHATTNSAHGSPPWTGRQGAGGDGEGRHAAAGPWRGDRRRRRYFRS
jgi:hypothetical protein